MPATVTSLAGQRAGASESPASNGLAALLLAIMLLSVGPSILRHAESAGLAFAAWRMVVGPLFGEKIRITSLVWTCLAIGGVSIMVVGAGENSGNSLFGDMLALLGMLAGTCLLVLSRNARNRHDALTYSTAMTIVAGAVLLPAAAVAEGTLMPLPVASDWPHVALMTALPGIGHVLTNYSVAYVKLHVVSNVHLLQPVLTAVVAWLVVDEPLVAAQIIGMGVTVAALFPLAREEQLRLRR